MDVGDHGNLQREVRRPLPRGWMIAGDAKPQHRLDADAVGRGRDGESGEAAEGTDEVTARDHGSPIVMQLVDATRLKRKWGALVQTLCTRSPEIHDGPTVRTCADQSSLSSVPNRPNCAAASRDGSLMPRWRKACEVSRRPRGVRCR